MKKTRMILALIILLTAIVPTYTVFAVTEDDYDYTLDKNVAGRKPISKSYVYSKTISTLGGDFGKLDSVQDLYIDEADNLYIADTGNNRIVKMDKSGKVSAVFTGTQDKPFNKPEGVFADKDGDIFVADTGNNRIVHLGSDGSFVEAFTKPESELLEANFVYNPRKVAVSSTGYIYSIKYQMLMQTDAYNRFRGYVGSTRVGFNLTQMFVRLFASKEQRSKLAKVEPSPYINFTMAEDGAIYATTLDYKDGQIKKLNSIGENIYPSNFLWEFSYNAEHGWWDAAVFEDIAVDRNGIVSVIDRVSAKIYQYDPEGNLLTVFGGRGSSKGMLSLPRCIEVDSQGNLYVYDAKFNIQVYKPTLFIQTVHEAIKNYSDGDYARAKEYWKQVLEICETYNLAHIGIGKTYFKKKMYREAVDEYYKALDKANYSQAFAKYRYELIRSNFTWFVLGLLGCLLLVFFLVRGLHKLSFVCEEIYKDKRKGV